MLTVGLAEKHTVIGALVGCCVPESQWPLTHEATVPEGQFTGSTGRSSNSTFKPSLNLFLFVCFFTARNQGHRCKALPAAVEVPMHSFQR